MEAIRTPLSVLNASKTPEKSGISSFMSNPYLDSFLIAILKTFLTSESTGTIFKSSLTAIDIGFKSFFRDSIKNPSLPLNDNGSLNYLFQKLYRQSPFRDSQ